MKLFSAFTYKSPREGKLTPEETRVREAAYALKTAEPWAVEIAAHTMAAEILKANLLTGSAISLIPVPNSTGDASANKTLCEKIAAVLKLWLPTHHTWVEDALGRSEPVIPQHTLPEGLRQKTKSLKLVLKHAPDSVCLQFLVDNVICSGQTLKAAKALVPCAKALVFADARKTHSILNNKRKFRSRFAVAEIRTLSTLRSKKAITGSSPWEIEEYHRLYIQSSPQFHPERENVVVILLDAKQRILGHEFITQGTKTSAAFQNAELLRPIVASGAHAFIMTHNHPSGDMRPSKEDVLCTKSLQTAADALGTNFVDHVIIGETKSFYSFRDGGYI